MYQYDFSRLMDGPDYENDYYAAALLNHEITGAVPYPVDLTDADSFQLSKAEIQENQYNGHPGVICRGRVSCSSGTSIEDCLFNEDYVGLKFQIDDITPYRYLVFGGRKIKDQGQPEIFIYDTDGNVIISYSKRYKYLDDQWQQYVIDISKAEGPAVIVMNGGRLMKNGDPDSSFVFSDIVLY